MAGYGKDTPDDYTQGVISEAEKSDAGRYRRSEAIRATARIASGERTKELAELKILAEAKLTEEGRFEDMTGVGDTIRALLPGTPEIKQQLINERAYEMARKKSGEATGESRIGVVGAFQGFGEEQSQMDAMILAELEKANAKHDMANEQRAKGQQKPLSAPPPKPGERS